MSYVHWAVAHIKDSDGRSLNLTEMPTITAYNIATEAAIATPAASLVNLAIGLYKVKITLDDITKVSFKVVPHVDDQSAVADIAMLDDGVVHAADEILTDTGTTLPATITAQTTALQGADGDTLETLSDQMDAVQTWTATNIAASVTGGSISQIRGDSWSIAIPDLTLDSNKIQFAIKLRQGQADAESILFIDSDGLQYVNGAAATDDDRTKASLSYVGTTLTVTVHPSITDDIAAGSYFYGIQSITAGGTVLEPYGGAFTVTADTVRAVA